MLEKIQKILSGRGITSRRKAEELIAAGRVSCNGTVCSLGDRADADIDVILKRAGAMPPNWLRLAVRVCTR